MLDCRRLSEPRAQATGGASVPGVGPRAGAWGSDQRIALRDSGPPGFAGRAAAGDENRPTGQQQQRHDDQPPIGDGRDGTGLRVVVPRTVVALIRNTITIGI